MALWSFLSKTASRFLGKLVAEVPCENQACESCRVTECSDERAAACLDRRCGEEQERSRRFASSVDVTDRELVDVPISKRWKREHTESEPASRGAPDPEPSVPVISQLRCRECTPKDSMRRRDRRK
jgi:hypothetical protein